MNNKRDINSVIGKNLQTLRKQYHLTQAELAEKLGISVSHVANIEGANSSISVNLIEKITEVFSITPNDIMLEKEQSEVQTPQKQLKELIDSKLSYLSTDLYATLQDFIHNTNFDSSSYSIKTRKRPDTNLVADHRKK
ncbi:helix-turn-helix transcriptional regulator [Treponema sp.]|uniref:helix-turn-helix domain-containing protein n=1 Tax=Treponema sp. TaxID=166 RepID=UPI00298E1CFD|nr:helix-turn-helix transcriptional regulator [Treponema sp.]MCR5613874.1 helix-turn-helix domain-containing protein [Treponema sp.]